MVYDSSFLSEKDKFPKWLNCILALFEEDKIDEVILNCAETLLICSKDTIQIKKHSFFSDLLYSKIIEEFQCFSMGHNQRLDPLHPFSGGVLGKNEFRWQCVIPPVVSEYPIFCIRRHRFKEITLEDFTFIQREGSSLLESIAHKNSLLITGATASGKTSFLAAFLAKFFMNRRVVFLEDYNELPLLSSSWVKLCSQSKVYDKKESISLNTLFEQSLRLRPDCLVIGEIRGEELEVFLNGMLSGYLSTVATIHSGSIDDLEKRIQFLISGKYNFLKNGGTYGSLWGLVLERSRPPIVRSISRLKF